MLRTVRRLAPIFVFAPWWLAAAQNANHCGNRGRFFSMQFDQLGFVIKRVDVADSSGAVDHQHLFGCHFKMR